jgi:hypothetical protein
MRIYAFIVTGIALVLAWLLFDQSTTNSASIKAEQMAREYFERKAEEAKKQDQILRDSIELFARIAENKHLEAEAAKNESQRLKRKATNSASKVNHEVIDSLAKTNEEINNLKTAYEDLDSLSQSQEITIAKQDNEIKALGTLVDLQNKSLINKDSIISNLEKSLSHAKVEIKLTEKHAKKKGFLRGAVVGGGAGLLLILLL